ncbi:MAG: HAD-IB family hydrolase [Actinocatenispora sp.]
MDLFARVRRRHHREAARARAAGEASAMMATTGSMVADQTDDLTDDLAPAELPGPAIGQRVRRIGNDPGAAAFFDVDNTFLRGASIFWFARGLAAHDFFTTRDLLGFAWKHLKFRTTSNEDIDDIGSARDSALAFVAGRRVEEIVEHGEEIYDELLAARIWAGTKAFAQLHLDAGQRVWLVTAAPVELAQLLARRLGLTGALGTVAETRDGRYTGRLVGDILHGPAKAEAVRALARSEHLDLDRCVAYSDSINDLPMLTTAGSAVAINPDAALRRVARNRGWEVHDFRTGRRAARYGVPAAIGLGAVAAYAYRRKLSR